MNNERLLELYRLMQRIRAFEDAAETASQGGVAAWGLAASAKPALVRGPLHLSTGQEAVAAAVCSHLERRDLLTSTHRGHGHTLAKGADPARMMCELFGRATGYNQGKGGSMHIADFSVGMLGANGVVAAGIPIATGAAHALKVRGLPQIVACFFGDGAANRGPFLEGLNWAQVYRLPVLFVCEDNRISATTPTDAMTAGEGVSARARALGLPSLKVDGNDVEAVHEAAARLVAEVRAGSGPRLLHAVTYRIKGHVSVDPGSYRDPDEVAAAMEADPLRLAAARLLERGVSQAEIDRIVEAARAEIAHALEVAEAAPWPEAGAAYEQVQNTGAGVWR
ncbi:MAG: acetoin dehydrogenase E1 component alpha-subunit [Burkholderiaceae bacterium]|jgi:pyruvate dehydrogenase E1 component alpha subunit|nr:MAG: acetoin dehydrogenase E1 component alpha-subunit [Burkholderiaceae bacterium]